MAKGKKAKSKEPKGKKEAKGKESISEGSKKSVKKGGKEPKGKKGAKKSKKEKREDDDTKNIGEKPGNEEPPAEAPPEAGSEEPPPPSEEAPPQTTPSKSSLKRPMDALSASEPASNNGSTLSNSRLAPSNAPSSMPPPSLPPPPPAPVQDMADSPRGLGTPINMGQDTFFGGICNISPKSEFRFVKKPGENAIKDMLVITNTWSTPLAFKVMTTVPDRYRVDPGSGLIPRGQMRHINIFLLPNAPKGKVEDKFLVMVLAVSDMVTDVDQIKHKWMHRSPDDRFLEYRLYCLQENLPQVTASQVANIPVSKSTRSQPSVTNATTLSKTSFNSPEQEVAYLRKKLGATQKECEHVVDYLIAQQLELENSLTKMFHVMIIFGGVALIVVILFVCIYVYQLYHSSELLTMCDEK